MTSVKFSSSNLTCILSRVSTAVVTRNIDIGILSVRLSVCHAPVLYRNGLKHHHTYFSVR